MYIYGIYVVLERFGTSHSFKLKWSFIKFMKIDSADLSLRTTALDDAEIGNIEFYGTMGRGKRTLDAETVADGEKE